MGRRARQGFLSFLGNSQNKLIPGYSRSTDLTGALAGQNMFDPNPRSVQ